MRKSFVILSVLLVLAIGFMIFRYQHQENTVVLNIEGKEEQTNRATSTGTGAPHKDSEKILSAEPPDQVERAFNEIIEHLEALHEPEPAAEDEQNSPAPEDPTDKEESH